MVFYWIWDCLHRGQSDRRWYAIMCWKLQSVRGDDIRHQTKDIFVPSPEIMASSTWLWSYSVGKHFGEVVTTVSLVTSPEASAHRLCTFRTQEWVPSDSLLLLIGFRFALYALRNVLIAFLVLLSVNVPQIQHFGFALLRAGPFIIYQNKVQRFGLALSEGTFLAVRWLFSTFYDVLVFRGGHERHETEEAQSLASFLPRQYRTVFHRKNGIEINAARLSAMQALSIFKTKSTFSLLVVLSSPRSYTFFPSQTTDGWKKSTTSPRTHTATAQSIKKPVPSIVRKF